MASKRLNITIEEGMYKLIEEAAQELYGGNVSRYLADALIYGNRPDLNWAVSFLVAL